MSPPEYDPLADFTAYRVYEWAPIERGSSGEAQMLDWRIRNAVDGELARKGYRRRTGAGEAEFTDFFVRYRLSVEEGSVNSFGDFFEYRASGGTAGLGEAYVRGFEEARLILELFDGQSRRLVWRAQVQAVVGDMDSEKASARVNEAVQKAFEGFPPR